MALLQNNRAKTQVLKILSPDKIRRQDPAGQNPGNRIILVGKNVVGNVLHIQDGGQKVDLGAKAAGSLLGEGVRLASPLTVTSRGLVPTVQLGTTFTVSKIRF